MCITDLAKFDWAIWWFGFKVEPILGKDQAAPKYVVHIKRGQKRHENNNLERYSPNLRQIM